MILPADHLGQTVIEAMYSRTNRYRALISRGSDGVFRVNYHEWDASYDGTRVPTGSNRGHTP